MDFRPLFFFGTLLDPALRRRVLGRTLPARFLTPATLYDFDRVHVAGRSYPMLVSAPGKCVAGLLANSLGDRDLKRLADYEGPEYVLGSITVFTDSGRHILARAYLCPSIIKPDLDRPWTLEGWQRRQR